MIALDFFYVLAGLLFAATALMNLRDVSNPRRFTTAAFWGLYALVYLAGERLSPLVAGVLMVAMALLAGCSLVRPGKSAAVPEEARRASAARLGHRLLVPALAIPVVGLRPLAEAISSAGGVAFSEVDENLMLRQRPGTYVAGEMLDWEAPTGGYLLQGCFSTGAWVARGIMEQLS